MKTIIIIATLALTGCNLSRTVTCDNGFTVTGSSVFTTDAGVIRWADKNGTWWSYSIPRDATCSSKRNK